MTGGAEGRAARKSGRRFSPGRGRTTLGTVLRWRSRADGAQATADHRPNERGSTLDNLTHALAGAALARAGLDRTTPLAAATLIVAANAPDVDILSYVHGSYFGLAFRRGITHGVPALIVLPVAVAGVMLAWDRWVRRGRRPEADPARPLPLLALAFLGVLTHPVLDWMNSYGMRWWLPFDGGWSYGDTLFIIDPWLWLGLGAAVYLSGTWRRAATAVWVGAALLASFVILVTAVPMAAKALWLTGLALTVSLGRARLPRTAGGRRTVAAALCVAALVYISTGVAATALARGDVRAAAAREGVTDVQALMVGPVPADPFFSEVVIRTADGYLRGTHHWGRSPRMRLDPAATIAFLSAPPGLDPATRDRAVDEALLLPDVGHYLTWSRFPYYRVEPQGNGYRVTVADARYVGRGMGSLGGVEVYVELP